MEIKREAGFTLIEILIAMSVFAIAILGVVAMQTSSIRGNMQARVIGEEMLDATSRVEALRMLAYSGADLTDGTHTDGNATWVVSTVNSGAADEYKTVDLTLTWQLRGVAKSYSVSFIKSEE